MSLFEVENTLAYYSNVMTVVEKLTNTAVIYPFKLECCGLTRHAIDFDVSVLKTSYLSAEK